MIRRSEAISSLRPNSEWTLLGTELIWSDPKEDEPTDEEIDAELKRMQDEYDAQAYARKRAVAYPEIGDQLDALYHAGVFPTDMAAKIKKVKDDTPKP